MIELLVWTGIIGVIVLAIAWIPEIMQIIRERKSNLNPKFAAIYCIGTFLLFVYALYIKDLPFTIVNGVIFAQVCIGLYYEFVVKKKTKRNRR